MKIHFITYFNSKLNLALRITFLLIMVFLLSFSSGCKSTTSTVKDEGKISPNLLRPDPVQIPQKTKPSIPKLP
ncbi:MAG: hypothetical protein ACYSTS_07645 [Planctomycetota bacterium]|jgi:hypothetical protein